MPKKTKQKISKKLQKEIKSNFVKYIGAGFGLVASFAWNDAIKSLIEAVFPVSGQYVWAKFAYAVVMTLVVVVLMVYIVRILKVEEEK
ncbi:MAG: DUF5654 family protein [Candidatus Magasanikbacteria bacterium]|nr:DUF5654 family protein [Candidatus Magasanikbacteria bacterium]